MAAQRLSTRWWTVAGFLALATTGAIVSFGLSVHAQGPHRPGEKATGVAKAVEDLHDLILELETQVQSQRALLRKTEATLQRVKVVYDDLGGNRGDPELDQLRSHEASLLRRIGELRRQPKSGENDSSIEQAEEELELLPAPIKASIIR